MKQLLILVTIFVLLAFGGTAIADSIYLAKKDKPAKEQKAKKEKKIKKEKKNSPQPNQKAYENANPNARFKRYEDYTPEEKEKLKKKKWSEMTDEEKAAVSERYKKNKEKLDEIIRGKKPLGEVSEKE